MAVEVETHVPERRRRGLILAALWVFILAVLLVFRSVVLPFAAAALIAYLVAPLVSRLTGVRFGKRHLPRWGAIVLIYMAFFTTVYLAFIALVPQLYRELARISRDAMEWSNTLTPERIEALSRELEAWFDQRGFPVDITSRSLEGGDVAERAPWETMAPAVEPEAPGHLLSVDLGKVFKDLLHQASSGMKQNFGGIVDLSRRVITAVLAGVFMMFFILMVAAFFSIDSARIRSYMGTLIPADHASDLKTLLRMIDQKLSGVVRGQVTICVVNGVLTFIGLLLLGVKFAFLLATIATVFSLIPIFGTIISSVPIVLIGLSQSWQTGVAALLWIIGIHALEAYVLNPKIMGNAARIHPIVVAFSLIAGERTFGLIGALFAVPLAAIVVACFDFLRIKAQPPPVPVGVTSTRAP